MQYEATTSIDTPAAVVWQVLSDVERWPDWTPTVTAVRLDQPVLGMGATATVTQPGRRPVRYRVDSMEDGRRFRWVNHSGGVRQWADHVVTADGTATTVRLTFAMQGPLGGLLGTLAARKIRQFVDTEAASLKQHAEHRAATG